MSEVNCYWIGEQGAVELCAADFQPPLPDYWVRWDDGDSLIGSPASRTYVTAYYGDGRAAQAAKVAASSGVNGVIVVAASYPIGDHTNGYTEDTYCAHYSTDYGFTYSAPVEYVAWQAGTNPGGYQAANGNWGNQWYHNGTAIDYDGSRFVIVNDPGNNEGYTPANPYSTIVTAVSTDGQNWTTNTVPNTNWNVMRCAAYNGDIWYLDNNDYRSLFQSEEYHYGINYSANDGASWSNTRLGSNTGAVCNKNAPREEFTMLSANSLGCHVAGEIFHLITFDFGIYYWRPTGVNSWDTPILLWDHDNDFPTAPGQGADDYTCEILASRYYDANLVVSIKMGYDFTSIWLKRSTDGGQIWSAEQKIVTMDYTDPRYENFRWQQASNMFRLLELTDGRLVVVYVMEAYYGAYYEDSPQTWENWPGWITYIVSEDGGQSWSSPTLVSPWWVQDPVYYGERIEACARGIDVVVTGTERGVGSYNLIFRPTATPDGEFLIPPSMTLPSPPTTGWP